jgi:hypothetical protein
MCFKPNQFSYLFLYVKNEQPSDQLQKQHMYSYKETTKTAHVLVQGDNKNSTCTRTRRQQKQHMYSYKETTKTAHVLVQGDNKNE